MSLKTYLSLFLISFLSKSKPLFSGYSFSLLTFITIDPQAPLNISNVTVSFSEMVQ
jgi:hypothetical protein